MISTSQALMRSIMNHQVRWVAACTLLSGLGLVIHNRADLPQLPWLSPETSIPLLISFCSFWDGGSCHSSGRSVWPF